MRYVITDEFKVLCPSCLRKAANYKLLGQYDYNYYKVLKCDECKQFIESDEENKEKLREARIEYMVNRFLGWKLPEDFAPDCGITFKQLQYGTVKHHPIGTNLFTAIQARDMIKYLLEEVEI